MVWFCRKVKLLGKGLSESEVSFESLLEIYLDTCKNVYYGGI